MTGESSTLLTVYGRNHEDGKVLNRQPARYSPAQRPNLTQVNEGKYRNLAQAAYDETASIHLSGAPKKDLKREPAVRNSEDISLTLEPVTEAIATTTKNCLILLFMSSTFFNNF